MSGPSLGDIIEVTPALKALVNKLFAAIEAASPVVATQDEEAIKNALLAAMDGIDVASLESSLMSVLTALKSLRSVQGGGVDATLA